jgi:hypothetical protein
MMPAFLPRLLAWSLAAILLAGIAGPVRTGTPERNEHVRCDASLSASSFRRGASGEIRMLLTPEAGIHVNGSPPPEVILAPGSVATVEGSVGLTPDSAGYLRPGAPVVQRIAIPGNAPRGKHHLRGTLTYYYCSDTEGWCMQFRQQFELRLTIIR